MFLSSCSSRHNLRYRLSLLWIWILASLDPHQVAPLIVIPTPARISYRTPVSIAVGYNSYPLDIGNPSSGYRWPTPLGASLDPHQVAPLIAIPTPARIFYRTPVFIAIDYNPSSGYRYLVIG
ncbi:hypothetical protein K435DRAFT_879861 [Dendrothele bispora CBS 962.96]|uniref:Secreted protein n=1 Tax=Dendrothele bispora (strain CBS 962.96) TaxID=1314807 RepID=A0A4S8KKE8_DENBC|nr:hypothetical protein K435DRAFT_879861 [Dendrothele bispora CBS 962.96]